MQYCITLFYLGFVFKHLLQISTNLANFKLIYSNTCPSPKIFQFYGGLNPSSTQRTCKFLYEHKTWCLE